VIPLPPKPVLKIKHVLSTETEWRYLKSCRGSMGVSTAYVSIEARNGIQSLGNHTLFGKREVADLL
jgi:hypothetical protein